VIDREDASPGEHPMSEERWHKVRKARSALLVLVVAFIGLLTSCSSSTTGSSLTDGATETEVGSGGGSGGAGAAGISAQQVTFRQTLANDRSALLKATITYPHDLDSNIGQPADLHVSIVVLGSTSIPETATPLVPIPPTQATSTTASIGGAIVGVTAGPTSGVTISAESTERQPLLEPGDTGSWLFALDSNAAASYIVTLHVTAYDQGTDNPLQTDDEDVAFTVGTTVGQRSERIASSTGSIIVELGSIAGGIAAIAALVFGIRKWIGSKRKKAATAQALTAKTVGAKGKRRHPHDS
jgi:hypothetical protein